jgi:triacylglycerol lipase
MTAKQQHVFLIPGFFGFANLGEILYFAHVHRFLPQACAELGLDVACHAVPTYPTASLRKRAERLLEEVAQVAGEDDAPIHLVGHSSGGLDARLLVTPQSALRTEVEAEPFAKRVRSVVMISTPNHGTPVASFFTSIFGQKLLQLLSLGTIYALWFGKLPASVVFKIGAAFARTRGFVSDRTTLVDQLFTQLLGDFTPERREALQSFFVEVGDDQALLPQLTPEGVDALNAGTGDRPGVRYGSVISYARRPGLVSTARVGLSPYGQTTHALFFALHRMASGMSQAHLPQLTEAQVDVLLQTYGMIPDSPANDGVVPILSQIWGEVIHATKGDHLDLLGHFGQAHSEPAHVDWLSSGSGFNRQRFEALWTDVARFLAGRRSVTKPPGSRVQHMLHLFERR